MACVFFVNFFHRNHGKVDAGVMHLNCVVTGVTCPQLTPPANGSFSGNESCSTIYGSWCHFDCDNGYGLTGSGVRRCLAQPGVTEGFWDGFEVQCEGSLLLLFMSNVYPQVNIKS